MEERRKYKRTELKASLVIKRLDKEERLVDIKITDVSMTGLGFHCEEVLTVGAVYEAFVTIWTKETLHTFLRIVRTQLKEPIYDYGAIFIGMSEMDAARIQVYQTMNGDWEE